MKKHFELNGTKGWIFSFVFLIIVQSAAIAFWAGSLSKDVKNIKEDIIEIKDNIKGLNNV